MKIITRDDARRDGLTRYFLGEECRNGHISHRYTSSGVCVECNKISVKKSAKSRGRKCCPKYKKAWNLRNKDKLIFYQKTRDRSKLIAKNIRKRAALRMCTPSWLTDEHKAEMKRIYDHAKDATITSGEQYDVDHIIPINGEEVCGLHVPWNLQILPSDINRRKRNKLEYK